MNRARFPISAVCCLMFFALLFLSLGAVSAQSMESMDDMAMEDDMAMDDMMMADDMAMDDDMMMMAPPRICTDLPAHIAVYSDSMDTNCRNVGTDGIGVMSVVDAGVISAIDIWSSMGVDAEVCFSIAGPVTVLDASTSPRTAMMPAMYMSNNLNCVHLTAAATVVLGTPSPDEMMMDDMAMDDDMMMDDDMAMADDMMMDDDMAMDDMMMDDDMAMADDMMMDDDMAMDDDMMMDDDMAMADDMMMDDDMAMDDMMMDDDMAMGDDMMMDDMMMMAPPRICTDLPAHVAVYGDAMSVNCRDVGAAGIGVMSIIDAGVISAIDIWSTMAVDVEVCFSIAGPITVLDASTAPRMAMMPDAYMSNNLHCVHLTSAATVVLGMG